MFSFVVYADNPDFEGGKPKVFGHSSDEVMVLILN